MAIDNIVTENPRALYVENWLPDKLKSAKFGSIEGKVIVVTGSNSGLQIFKIKNLYYLFKIKLVV